MNGKNRRTFAMALTLFFLTVIVFTLDHQQTQDVVQPNTLGLVTGHAVMEGLPPTPEIPLPPTPEEVYGQNTSNNTTIIQDPHIPPLPEIPPLPSFNDTNETNETGEEDEDEDEHGEEDTVYVPPPTPTSTGSSGGSGGSSTIARTCNPHIVCEEWSPCYQGSQSRRCEDRNGCEATYEDIQQCGSNTIAVTALGSQGQVLATLYAERLSNGKLELQLPENEATRLRLAYGTAEQITFVDPVTKEETTLRFTGVENEYALPEPTQEPEEQIRVEVPEPQIEETEVDLLEEVNVGLFATVLLLGLLVVSSVVLYRNKIFKDHNHQSPLQKEHAIVKKKTPSEILAYYKPYIPAIQKFIDTHPQLTPVQLREQLINAHWPAIVVDNVLLQKKS